MCDVGGIPEGFGEPGSDALAETAFAFGYKTLDGQKIGYFFFPFAEGHTAQYGRLRRHRYPGEIGLVLPQSGLDALGPMRWWSATVNVDGKDIGFCPVLA